MRFHTFLLKYGEIGIKGKNRYLFEDALVRQVRYDSAFTFIYSKRTLMSTNPRQESMWTVRVIMITRIRWNI